jgi:subfamily B ATP-binding cassette protein MsbA
MGDPGRQHRRARGDIARMYRFLLPHVWPWKHYLIAALGFTAAFAALVSAQTWLVPGVLELFSKAGFGKKVVLTEEQLVGIRAQVELLAKFAVFIAAGRALTDYAKEYFQACFVMRVVISIRERVAAHLTGLSMRFYVRQRMGDLYSRLTNDVAQTQQALTFLFGDIVEDVLTLGFLAVIAVYASALLSLSVLVLGPLVIWPISVLSQKLRRRARGRQSSMADVTESMQQMLSGMRTVKVYGNEAHELDRYHRRNEEFFDSNLKVTKVRALARSILELINHTAVPILLLGGVYLVQQKYLEAQRLAWFVAALISMYNPAKRLTRNYTLLQESLAGLDRIEEILDQESELREAPDAARLEKVRGELALRGVTFSYGADTVLSDVSFEARPGEVVALVGPSGGGKSTILDLIARFYDPVSGTVEVDGHDLRKLARRTIVDSVVMVTQDPFLFNESVLQNVRYGRRDATMDEVIEACKAANIHDVIAALPQGYETLVGERGATLSGGQRQRITIARALLKDPRILLLDEATSALDTESERVVQEALDRLMKGRTTVVVAHRLSTVIGADRIVVIDKGRVLEQGAHDELIKAQGKYYSLYTMKDREPASTAP